MGPTAPRRLEFSERLRLREGPNTLTVTAHSGAGTTAQATRTLQVQKAGGRVWAVLVGINTFIVTRSGGSQGLGFAVPSNIVPAVFDQIRQTGRVRRGSIGISAQTITPALAAGLQLERLTGVVVGDLYPSGPGEAAGLQPGDVILTLDGKCMETFELAALSILSILFFAAGVWLFHRRHMRVG